MAAASARNICFTLNNPTSEEEKKLQEYKCTYLVYGREVGESGTPHLQGYWEFGSSRRFSTLKKAFPRMHFEKRRGTGKQAADYCKKDGNIFEKGEMQKQGNRTDIQWIRQHIREKGMRGLMQHDANYQQIRIAEKYLTYDEHPRNEKPEVTWIWGPTGTGKSYNAFAMAGNDAYWKNDGSKWWDGYDAHETVVIDDFRPSWWPITEMLALLDRYPKRVEYKGGSRQFRAKKIIVTSALEPSECYKNTGESVDQLLRRIDKTIHMIKNAAEVAGNTKMPQLEPGSPRVGGVPPQPPCDDDTLATLARYLHE